MLPRLWQDLLLKINKNMINGIFVENMPLIKVVVGSGRSVQTPFVILDTGFTGDLQVTPKIAKELDLQIIGVTKTQMANGEVNDTPVALAIAAMEGAVKSIQVLISNSVPLAGISFLSKFDYKTIIDCKYRRIMLEKVLE